MWGRLSDGLQLFQDKLDSVIDKTLKEVTDDSEGPQEGNRNSDDVLTGHDVTKEHMHMPAAHTTGAVTESEHEKLRKALEEAEHQNQHINREFRQLLRDKEVKTETKIKLRKQIFCGELISPKSSFQCSKQL